MILIGIDQGLHGALAAVDMDTKTVVFRDTVLKPSVEVDFLYLHDTLSSLLERHAKARITIEKLAVFGDKTTRNAAFSLGKTQGVTESAISLIKEMKRSEGVALEIVWEIPSRWKRKMGLIGKSKQDSKALALHKASILGIEMPKKFRHDCAEAFLIAML